MNVFYHKKIHLSYPKTTEYVRSATALLLHSLFVYTTASCKPKIHHSFSVPFYLNIYVFMGKKNNTDVSNVPINQAPLISVPWPMGASQKFLRLASQLLHAGRNQ